MNYLYLILSLLWTVGVPILCLIWLMFLTYCIDKMFKTVAKLRKEFRVQLTPDQFDEFLDVCRKHQFKDVQ